MIITAIAAAAAVMGRYFKSICVHIGATLALMERTWRAGGWWGGRFDSVSISVLPLIRAVFYT